MSEYPMISCIMPTIPSRRPFVAQAIRYFNAQDYPNKELIIIDDGEIDRVCDVVPAQENIEYLYLDTLGAQVALTIGAKRNLACSLAKGEYICHWDDDDYYGPHRLMWQASPLVQGKADITGMVMSLLLRTGDMTLWKPSQAVHDSLFTYRVRAGTLLYRASLWNAECSYANSSRGEDIAFLAWHYQRGRPFLAITDPASYICVRHGGNVTDALDVSGWEPAPLEQYLSEEQQAFYAGLKAVTV